MSEFKIYLDGFCEEIFHKMEEISEGLHGHECLIVAEDKEEAADRICTKLKIFIMEQLESV